MPIYVGTSGWQYQSWRGPFYRERLPQRSWLEYYAEHFRTVELNNSFYRLPKPETFSQWHDRTPADFVFAVKMSRYLTHIKRLQQPEEPVHRFLDAVEPLGSKLGPVLVQLPPTLAADEGRLRRVLDQFPGSTRVTVEFRHNSWATDATQRVLADHDVATCWADRKNHVVTPLWRTAGWGFLRFHEGRRSPQPCYGTGVLERWVERIGNVFDKGDDVFVYFNNDAGGCAVKDARTFAHLAEKAGWKTTRVPVEPVSPAAPR